MSHWQSVLIVNAQCYDPKGKSYQWCDLLVRDGIVCEKKEPGQIKGWPQSNLLDLAGQFLYPGLIDAHCHLLGIGQKLSSYDLERLTSLSEFQQTVRALQESAPNDRSPMVLRGWDEVRLQAVPVKEILDQICLDRPMVCVRRCGHLATANSCAIETYGLTALDGVNGSDAQSGVFKESALEMIYQKIASSAETQSRNWETAALALRSWGVTTVHSDDLGNSGWESLSTLLRHQNQIRVWEKLNVPQESRMKKWLEEDPGLFGTYSPFSKVGAIKLFLDGSLGGSTAYLTDPYHDNPSSRGELLMDEERWASFVTFAERMRLTICVHVIGDGALEVALRGFSRKMEPGNPLRHRLIHAQLASKDQLRMIKKLGLYVSIQPSFYPSDQAMSVIRLGTHRLREIGYPFDRMLDMGIPLTLSTDAPVEDYHPWKTLRDAVRFMDIHSAFDAYTIEAAKAGFQEEEIGLWEVGYFADGFVLAQDLFGCTAEEIARTEPVGTIFDGVWTRKNQNGLED